MSTSIDYLEAAKLEELTSQFRNEGYDVILNPGGDDQGYDLIAEKNGTKVAVEVKFNARLRESADKIKALRRRALERGFDEFRLVVVSPPHETNVYIEGLDKKLVEKLAKFLKDNPPNPAKTHPLEILGVHDLDIDSISITAQGTRVTGSGVVSVVERPVSGVYVADYPLDDVQWKTDSSFDFDIQLDCALKVSHIYKANVDTSTWMD